MATKNPEIIFKCPINIRVKAKVYVRETMRGKIIRGIENHERV